MPYRDVFNAYVECALWSSTDDNGEPLDRTYSAFDIAPESLAKMDRECRDFYGRHLVDAQNTYGATVYNDGEQAGHDFWFTRNHHGAGFWDRGLGEMGDVLTKASHAYGSCDLYIGDDGKVYAA